MTYSSAARGNCVAMLGVIPYSHSALVSTQESEWELLICLGNFRNILATTLQHLLPEMQ